MTLNDLSLNDEAIVKKINGEEIFIKRLNSMGFTTHSKVKCVLISPFKDPKGFFINNVVIALRNDDAKKIEVDYE